MIIILLVLLVLSVCGLALSQVEQVDLLNSVGISLFYDLTNVVMTFLKNDGSNSTLTIKPYDPIAAIMNDICSKVHMPDCIDVADNISHWLHGSWYTPSLPHAAKEDYDGNRYYVVKHFADNFHYSDYLEIGTFQNHLFDKAKVWFSNAVGVDPVQGGTLRMTSDEFFANNTEYFDIIFVDGLHEANQVFKDIHNALNWLNPGGVIIMHDCNPRSFEIQDGKTKGDKVVWTGDTWKAAVALRLRKDIEIVVVDVDYGVGVIRRRENQHPLPAEWVKYLDVNPISMLTYDLYEKHKHVFHRMMTMADMRAWLNEEISGNLLKEL